MIIHLNLSFGRLSNRDRSLQQTLRSDVKTIKTTEKLIAPKNKLDSRNLFD